MTTKLLWLYGCSWLVVGHSCLGRCLVFQRDCFDAHRVQTRKQKCCAEPLAVDFPVDLLRRLLDSKLFKQPRKLLVSNIAAIHLPDHLLSCKLLPFCIRKEAPFWRLLHDVFKSLSRRRHMLAWCVVEGILGRIRPVGFCPPYTFSKTTFPENAMPTIQPSHESHPLLLPNGGVQ